jgi:hypothetical protein
MIRRDTVWLAGRFDIADARVRAVYSDVNAWTDYRTIAEALTAATWLAAHGPEHPAVVAALRQAITTTRT